MLVFMDNISAVGDAEEVRTGIRNRRKMETLKKFEYGLKKTKIYGCKNRKRGSRTNTGKSAARNSAGDRPSINN